MEVIRWQIKKISWQKKPYRNIERKTAEAYSFMYFR